MSKQETTGTEKAPRHLRLPVINKVEVIGHIVKDAEMRYTGSKTPVTNFSIGHNRRYKQGEEWKEQVSYFNIVAWNGLATATIDRLKKGTPVLIEGELRQRNWEDEQNVKHSTVEIVARSIQVLEKRATVEADDAAPIPGEEIPA